MDKFSASELEKVINDLEFEYQQYGKQIEKETQEINLIEKKFEEISREIREEENQTPLLDEYIKNHYKQFKQNGENIENLKKTLVLSNENNEELKLKVISVSTAAEESRKERKKQLDKYENIWESYKTQYESFPEAQEVLKQEEDLNAVERDFHKKKEHLHKLLHQLKQLKYDDWEEIKKNIVKLVTLKKSYDENLCKLNDLEQNNSRLNTEIKEIKQEIKKNQNQKKAEKNERQQLNCIENMASNLDICQEQISGKYYSEEFMSEQNFANSEFQMVSGIQKGMPNASEKLIRSPNESNIYSGKENESEMKIIRTNASQIQTKRQIDTELHTDLSNAAEMQMNKFDTSKIQMSRSNESKIQMRRSNALDIQMGRLNALDIQMGRSNDLEYQMGRPNLCEIKISRPQSHEASVDSEPPFVNMEDNRNHFNQWDSTSHKPYFETISFSPDEDCHDENKENIQPGSQSHDYIMREKMKASFINLTPNKTFFTKQHDKSANISPLKERAHEPSITHSKMLDTTKESHLDTPLSHNLTDYTTFRKDHTVKLPSKAFSSTQKPETKSVPLHMPESNRAKMMPSLIMPERRSMPKLQQPIRTLQTRKESETINTENTFASSEYFYHRDGNQNTSNITIKQTNVKSPPKQETVTKNSVEEPMETEPSTADTSEQYDTVENMQERYAKANTESNRPRTPKTPVFPMPPCPSEDSPFDFDKYLERARFFAKTPPSNFFKCRPMEMEPEVKCSSNRPPNPTGFSPALLGAGDGLSFGGETKDCGQSIFGKESGKLSFGEWD